MVFVLRTFGSVLALAVVLAVAGPVSTARADVGVVTFTTQASTPRQLAGARQLAGVSTVQRKGIKSWKLFGKTLMEQEARVTYSFDGKRLREPKSTGQSAWGTLGITVQESKHKWNYYTATLGQSDHFVKFLLGIPTPFGGVGSHVTNTINANVKPDGTCRWFY